MPSWCNVCNSRIQNLSILSLILFPTWIVVNDIHFGSTKVIQWVPRRQKVLTHGQESLFRKVTSVSIHSFVEWLDTFSYVLRPADVKVKEVNHIRCFAIELQNLILLSCRLIMELLCVLQLETALATLVTTWFTSERYNVLFREQLGQRFTFFQFFSNDDGRCLKFSLKRDGKWEQKEPVCWSFFLVFHWPLKTHSL